MVNSVVAPRFSEPGVVQSPTHERLTGLRGSVYPDGEAATFTVQFTNQRPFKLLIPFIEMPAIFHEVKTASESMVNRQALSVGGGAEMMLEIYRNAMRPMHIDGLIDRRTGDRVFAMHFPDHAPLAVRLTLAQSFGLRTQMQALARSLAH